MKIDKTKLKKVKTASSVLTKLNKKQLKLAAFMCFVVGVLLIVAIFFKGESFKLGDIYPLQKELYRWIVVAVVVVFIIIIEIYFYKKITQYENSEDEKELSERDKQKLALDKFNNQQLDIAYNAKEKGRGFKSHWQYKKPWFMLLGDDGDNARLFDEFSAETFHRTLPEHNDSMVQWSFTPSATLLSVKENLWNHQDDLHQSLWLHFNGWILEQRRKRPINGVVLAIDVEQLVRKDNVESPSFTSTKAKLASLNKAFGNKVPVYLIVTQLSKLDGFEAFKKTLSDEQLNSLFGFSLAFDQDDQDLGFDQQYKELENTLNTSLIRSSLAPNANVNKQAYLFIREFAGLKNTLQELTSVFGSSSIVNDALTIRGIYFTANETADDNALKALPSTVSAIYDLPNQASKTLSSPIKNKSLFFAQQLLDGVLLPESGLVANNSHHVKQHRDNVLLAYVVTGMIIALLCAAWLYFYKKNQYESERVLALIESYQALEQLSASGTSIPPLHLQTLDRLRTDIAQNQDKSYIPVALRDMGMGVKPVIRQEEEKTYRRMLSNDFLPVLVEQQVDQLEKQLANNERAKLHEKDIEQLKVIRLLNIHTGQLNQEQKEKVNTYRKQLVFPWMETYWKQHYKNYNQIEGSLRQHLDYVLENNIQSESDSRINQRLSALQNHEQDLPTDEKIYQEIKKQVAKNYPTPLHLQHHLGAKLFQVFEPLPNHSPNKSPLSIPYLYTQQGFAAYKAIDYKQLLQSFSFDAWVLGGNNHLQNYSDLEILQLKKQVKEHYISDYESTWLAAINSLNIKHFQTPNDALVFLTALTGKDSPYKKLLQQVKENTLLPIPKPTPPVKSKDKKDGDKASETATLSDEQKIEKDIALSLKASFEFINELSKKDEEGNTYIKDIFKILAAVQKKVKKIATPQKKPEKAASVVSVKADPIETLLDMSGTVDEPFQSQLQQIALDSQALITQRTTVDINHDWQQIVYRFYTEKIKGKYPLAKAGQDVSMDDFKLFFGKDGMLDKFYNKHLSKLYGDKSNEKTFHQVSPVLEMYQHALFIQQAFFNEAGDYHVEFTIEPTVLSNVFINSILNLEGTKITYQHDETKPTNLIWPSKSKDKHKSSLTLNPIEKNTKNAYIAKEGEWALFHLIDQSKTHALKDRERNIRFKQGSGLAGYKLTVPKSFSPLTKDILAGFDIPPNLLISAHKQESH